METSGQNKDLHDWCHSLFLNKASLFYACLKTKMILWSRQAGDNEICEPQTRAWN